MSPRKAGRLTDAATRPRPAEHPIPTAGADIPVLDDANEKNTPDAVPWPPRPVSPARVGASQNAHSQSFDDPSNYLG